MGLVVLSFCTQFCNLGSSILSDSIRSATRGTMISKLNYDKSYPLTKSSSCGFEDMD